jgi:hypothetical protein
MEEELMLDEEGEPVVVDQARGAHQGSRSHDEQGSGDHGEEEEHVSRYCPESYFLESRSHQEQSGCGNVSEDQGAHEAGVKVRSEADVFLDAVVGVEDRVEVTCRFLDDADALDVRGAFAQ